MFFRKPDAAVCAAFLCQVQCWPKNFAKVNANLWAKILDFVLQFFKGRFTIAAFKLGIVDRVGTFGRDLHLHCVGGAKECVLEEGVWHSFHKCSRFVDVT